MREILFKGKREDNGEWVEGSLSIQNGETLNDGTRTFEYRIMGMRGELDYVDPETVCQYTGLKGKNGKKIFEGDIVRAKVIERGLSGVKKYTSVYEVAYHPKYCYFYLKKERNNLLFDGNWSYGVFIEDVIGNIFDNPELLEVAE